MQKTSTNELEQPVLEGNDRLGGTWIAATPTATLQLYPFHDNEEVIDEFTTVLLIMFGQSERARTQADFFSKLPEDLELERKRHRDDRHPLSVQPARKIHRWLEDPDLVRRWQKILVPQMQMAVLESVHGSPKPWSVRELVEKELARRSP